MNTIDIVRQGYFENGVFKLDIQLEREEYIRYADVLARFGGKWNKKANGHVFDGDVSPYLDLYLNTGELPDKNPLAFFYTPENVIDTIFAEMGRYIGFSSLRYLEPSAGTGSIVNRLLQEGSENITAVELDPYRFKILENKNMPGVRLINADFLTHQFDKKFDVIIMNPPFSVDGNSTCYIDHIKKAYSLLAAGGILASVVPVGWINSSIKKQKEFRDWVYENGYYFRLDEKSFKESGTLVGCAIIVIEKYTEEEYKNLYETEHCGYLNWFVFNLCLNADCDEKFYEKKPQLHRKIEDGLDISSEVKYIYLEVVDNIRKNGEFMPVKEEWLDWLVREFIKEYEDEYK
jgi:predicted RNA methylase